MSHATTANPPYSEIKIYARSTSGRFTRLRWTMVWLTQLVFYGLPWLTWNARQAVLFDLETRRFYLFDLVLYPQDFIYLTLLLIISALGLFFVTTLAGRIWCGFSCPQSVYTQIFMWLEQRFEGDRSARMRLDASPWSIEKFARKTGKQFAWISISLLTGFTFVGYFTPIHSLAEVGMRLSLGAWESFWVLFYGLATYGNAGYLREQVCKHMCPYARFQSAMFDRDTLIIGYDTNRGDPRGSRARGSDARSLGLGDCINCTMCVQVCPTGIDIRDGLQSNCIGCAACIDACDDVMDKIGSLRGLIRYSTQNGIENAWSDAHVRQRMRRPRVLVYGGLLLVLCASFVVGIGTRSPLKMNVIRDRGVLTRTLATGEVENVYRLQIMHALERPERYQVSVHGFDGLSINASQPVEVTLDPVAERMVPVTVRLQEPQASELAGQTLPIQFRVKPADDASASHAITEASSFLVPR